MRSFNPEQFLEICKKNALMPKQRQTIGTLREKTLHAVLKQYYEPFSAMHEVKIGKYIADIINEDGVLEIQTGSFTSLQKKLDCFLTVTNVTIVCPVVRCKWLVWVEPETGELVSRRKSPKTGAAFDVCYQLCSILPYLTNPKLTVCLPLVDIEEYRMLCGWDQSKKRGSRRIERIPLSLAAEYRLNSREDYRRLLPLSSMEPFTSATLARLLNRSLKRTRPVIKVLETVGVIKRRGKSGRHILYEINCTADTENLC